MKSKTIKDLSASSGQVVLNQLLGLVIFYITSRYLTKEQFGELNWSLATASLLFASLTLGIDLIIVRKIAVGENLQQTGGLYLTHVIYSGCIVILLLVLCYLLFPNLFVLHVLLPGILVSQLFSFFASPFKQVANGKRAFRKLAKMSTISALVKSTSLLICLLIGKLTIQAIIIIFIAGSVAEMLTGIILMRTKSLTVFPLYWHSGNYLKLVKESFPQFGVTVFNIVLARFDWFILGLLATTTITAEYSFAFKVFELARLPLLIISPVLIPLFAKIFSTHSISQKIKTKLLLLFRAEMLLSVILPLLLASCWTPLIDSITSHKYGATNENVFLVLAICIPLQFATDYYWNICFAQQQLRLTFLVAVSSCIINILLNLLLIPVYGAMGAAIAYLSCFLLQLILFKIYTRQEKLKPDIFLLVKALLSGILSVWVVKNYISSPFAAVPAALILYCILALANQLIILKKINATLNIFMKK